MSNVTENILTNLTGNISNLLDLNKRIKESNFQLLAEKEEMQSKLAGLQKAYNELEVKYSTLKLAKSITGEATDNAEVKNRMNNLVREIDKCIALLNK